jgi:hypothetical protein
MGLIRPLCRGLMKPLCRGLFAKVRIEARKKRQYSPNRAILCLFIGGFYLRFHGNDSILILTYHFIEIVIHVLVAIHHICLAINHHFIQQHVFIFAQILGGFIRVWLDYVRGWRLRRLSIRCRLLGLGFFGCRFS